MTKQIEQFDLSDVQTIEISNGVPSELAIEIASAHSTDITAPHVVSPVGLADDGWDGFHFRACRAGGLACLATMCAERRADCP